MKRMPKVLIKKRLDGCLVPSDHLAEDALRKIKAGTDIWAEIRIARNPKFHKLYFALISLTFQNQERYANAEHFRKAVQMAAGHVEEIHGIDGTIYEVPRSIAWDQLDDAEFGELFPQVMKVCAQILGDLDLDLLRAEVIRYAS